MIFDDINKQGKLVLSKEHSHKLYITSNIAYFTAFVALYNGYFISYFLWMYTGATSNRYWINPVYGGRRNVDIYMCLYNISCHLLLINHEYFDCNNYYYTNLLFYLGLGTYANALLFGRYFKSENISSIFHMFFHILINMCGISLYTC